MELNLVREEIPKITRAGGSGREAEPWENHLAELKDTAGISYRIWDNEKRASAVSRMSGVRNRLTTAVPHEHWTLAVRPVPNSDPARYGVYVAFEGTYTPEQVEENARKHKERSERVRASRAKRAEGEAGEASAPDTADTAPTPKERVAAANKAANARRAS